MNDAAILKKLLSITKESELENFLSSLYVADSSGPPKGKKYMWRFLSDRMSNQSNVHTTSVSIAPIIERVTNAFDANIQLCEYKLNKGNPMGKRDLPKSPRAAVEKWFNIPKGDTALVGAVMSDAERTKLAKDTALVELYDSDIERYPTVIVSDAGIGQHPDDFQKTLLNLGDSNKFTRPHLHGTFGHGGSSTYRFCKYSIIISRRATDARDKDTTLGWTIVRRDESMELWNYMTNKVDEINCPPVYEYLCLVEGQIPKIDAKLADKYFKQGTRITHIQYDAKEWENLSRGLGYRLFRNYLLDPVLPFRISDKRVNTQEFNRNMFGDRATLIKANYVPYRNEALLDWPTGGKLLVRYWLLHDEKNPANKPLKNHLERENSRETIIVTINGQRHGTLEKSLITKMCRLPRVGESLLVQVALDALPRETKWQLFTSGRERMIQEGVAIGCLKQVLIDCFSADTKLREWDDRLGDIRLVEDESVKAVKQLLDRLLTIGIEAGLGGSQELSVPGGTGIKKKYKPQDPPTSFKMKSSQNPLEISKGRDKKFLIELNGPDNLFSRRKNKGHVEVLLPNDPGITVSVMTSKFSDGRLPVNIFANKNGIEFDEKEIKFVFEADNLADKSEIVWNYVVLPEEKYVPVDPPTEFKILRNEPIMLTSGKKNTIPVVFNGPNDILTRPKDSANLEISFDYNKVKQTARIGPFNGKILITLEVEESAKEGDEFELSCKLALPGIFELTDMKRCKVQKKKKEEKKEKGDDTTISRPNYDIIPVRKEQWLKLGWNEENVGKCDLTKDTEGKDFLRLLVNADNCNIEEERNRRRRQSQTEKGIKNVETKYVAHIAYHLYQQYENESAEYDPNVAKIEEKEDENGALTDEQKEYEMKRVSRTLVLSFKALKDLDED